MAHLKGSRGEVERMRTHDHWMNAVSRRLLTVLLPLLCPITLFATDGHFLHGAGPVNEAMGGADTGICLDATGSIAWNPACTVLFKKHRLEFHLTIFAPWRSLSSTVEANAFGPGMPGATLSGTTESKRDMSFMPGLAFIYHPENSHNAYHFAMLAVSGFGVDYPENTDFSNPILTPQAPNGFGFGRIRSNYMLVTVPIGMSRQISDRFSAGISLVPAFSMLQVIPAPFYAPVTAGSTMPYYLSAGNQAPAFGFGVNAGLHYEINKVASVGFAYHSPIWFQDFKWNRKDLTGVSHEMTFQMNLPQVISMGVGLTPPRALASVSMRAGLITRTRPGLTRLATTQTAQSRASGGGIYGRWVEACSNRSHHRPNSWLVITTPKIRCPPIHLLQHARTRDCAASPVRRHCTEGARLGCERNILFHAFQEFDYGPWISAQGLIPGTA